VRKQVSIREAEVLMSSSTGRRTAAKAMLICARKGFMPLARNAAAIGLAEADA